MGNKNEENLKEFCKTVIEERDYWKQRTAVLQDELQRFIWVVKQAREAEYQSKGANSVIDVAVEYIEEKHILADKKPKRLK